VIALGFVYQVLATVLFVVALPYVLVRTLRYPAEMRERMGWSRATARSQHRPWWVHGASLGELQGVSGFLEHAAIAPEQALVTVLSVSARKQVGARLGGYRAVHAPLDFWFCLLPFFLRQRPRGLVVVETEIWPGWITAAAIAGIPVAVVSGRISDRNWSRIARWRWLYGPFCANLTAVASQTAVDAERWRRLGARNVAVTGNLKYRVPLDRSDAAPDMARATSGGSGARWIFVTGSLRRGEEAVIEVSRGLLASRIDVVLAPRHPKEIDHWKRACAASAVPVVLRSDLDESTPSLAQHGWDSGQDSARALLIDRHGELGAWYHLAAAAFVGGTLDGRGGHSLFEPASAGCPTAFGPSIENVRDVAEALLQSGGGTQIRNARELADWALSLRREDARREAQSVAALRTARELATSGTRTIEFLEKAGLDVTPREGSTGK